MADFPFYDVAEFGEDAIESLKSMISVLNDASTDLEECLPELVLMIDPDYGEYLQSIPRHGSVITDPLVNAQIATLQDAVSKINEVLTVLKPRIEYERGYLSAMEDKADAASW